MSSIAIKSVEIDSLKRLAAEFKAELGNQQRELVELILKFKGGVGRRDRQSTRVIGGRKISHSFPFNIYRGGRPSIHL